MATIITSECINCGACEPECPNTAIYAGGAPWELGGESHPAVAQDIFYIVAAKCTECVGFYDHEACAAVCPVDCCVPDPNNRESEEVLIKRAGQLHPEKSFGADFPSRFRESGGQPAPSELPAIAVGGEVGAAPAGDSGQTLAAAPVTLAAQQPSVPAKAAVANGPAAGPAPAVPKPAPKAPAPVAAGPAAPTPKPAPKAPSSVAAPRAPGAAAAGAAISEEVAAGQVAAAPLAMLNLPKDIGALPGPLAEKHFEGELEGDFDEILMRVNTSAPGAPPRLVRASLRLLAPILGALPERAKARLEEVVGDLRAFSSLRSTAHNIGLNLILYPAALTVLATLVLGDNLFSWQANGWMTLGLCLGIVEGAWRLREGIFYARPSSEMRWRGAWYGLALAPLCIPLTRGAGTKRAERKVAFDGFTIDLHDDKIERDRRYGTVYTVSEAANAYLVRLEMPRRIPMSSLKRLWSLPDEMPDYDYHLALDEDVLVIKGSVRGEALRRLSYISASFPADFMTRIEFAKPVNNFKHRLRNKVLEIIVFKGEAPARYAA